MKLSRNLEENRKMMAKLFPIEKSFDLIERQVVIGGKKAVMYFIDGFVKDGVMGKIMQFFLGLTPDQLENVNTAQDFAARFVSYVEVSTESNVEKITTQYLSGPAILMIARKNPKRKRCSGAPETGLWKRLSLIRR